MNKVLISFPMFLGAHISTLLSLNSSLNRRTFIISYGLFFNWENVRSYITLCGVVRGLYVVLQVA